MIGIIFIYSFMAGASYAVGLGALQANRSFHDKYTWINRPLALITGLVWPFLFLFFISAKVLRAVSSPNVELTGPQETQHGK